MSKWIYDLNTTQFAEIPTFVSKCSRWQLHEGVAVCSARVRLGESHVLLLVRRQLADVENWGRIPTKTGKDRETSKIHWLSQLWPAAPIYCDCERNTLSDVIATSYDRDSDCGDGEGVNRPNTYLTSFPLVSVRHHGRVTAKVEINFLLECKIHCPSAQLMLRQLHSTNLSERIEAKNWVSWLSFGV